MQLLQQKADINIADIISKSIKFDFKNQKTLIVFDTQNELTKILTNSYKKLLPEAKLINIDASNREEIITSFNQMSANDLVVLIQSSSFRLDKFRIRLHLFNLNLRVIEHLHLYRNPEETWEIYIDSLAYDENWYHTMGKFLINKLDTDKDLIITSSDQENN